MIIFLLLLLLGKGYCLTWKEVPFVDLEPSNATVEKSYVTHGDFDQDGNQDIFILISNDDKSFSGSYFKSEKGVFSQDGRVDIVVNPAFDVFIEPWLQKKELLTDEGLRVTEVKWYSTIGQYQKSKVLVLDAYRKCIWFLDPFTKEVSASLSVDLNEPRYFVIADFDDDGHDEIIVSEEKENYQVFRYNEKEESIPFSSSGVKQYPTPQDTGGELGSPILQFKPIYLNDLAHFIGYQWPADPYRLELLQLNAKDEFSLYSGFPVTDNAPTFGQINSVNEKNFTFDFYHCYNDPTPTPNVFFYDCSQMNGKTVSGYATGDFQGLDGLQKAGFVGQSVYVPGEFNLKNIICLMMYFDDDTGNVSRPTLCLMKGDGTYDLDKHSISFQVGNILKEYSSLPDAVAGFLSISTAEKFTWVTSEKGKVTIFYEQ